MPLPPGHACVFSIQGVCVHPQTALPGPAHGCARLARLLERWDDFLDRAEAFGLSEETAARIWSARMNGFVLRRKECPAPARFPAAAGRPPFGAEGAAPVDAEGAAPVDAEGAAPIDAEGAALGCPHLWRGACLLALPECRGVCAQYRRRGRADFFP